MRTPIIAGNWKMHKTVSQAVELCRKLEAALQDSPVEVVVCPPFTALSAAFALGMSKVKLGAQNMYAADKGAYTGEISPVMLKDVGCQYVILGHSERRQYFKEDDEFVAEKAAKAFEYGIKPIICVGESLEQRRAGQTTEIVVTQTKGALAKITPDQISDVVIAYEPIWAIGTGENATGADANEVIGTIRATIAELFGQDKADQVRIQYGGSVKPENIAEFMHQPEIDGALVGGASLSADDFIKIVQYK
ncbi:MAG: triose-phosphate isomerase [Firmicutes bacterium]|jgi:triosephosphate isomerase|nr:triose-phosphate isomerase [Bacillota bacterium]